MNINPQTDLKIERTIEVSPELIWQAWTNPEYLKQWFVPRPWTISHCELDLRPGGLCSTTMRSPEGQEFPNVGCYLEIIPNQKLVFTDALGADFRPKENAFFTAVILIEAHGTGTKYTAIALHKDEAGRKQHEDMGFFEGWGITIDQMVEVMKTKEAQ